MPLRLRSFAWPAVLRPALLIACSFSQACAKPSAPLPDSTTLKLNAPQPLTADPAAETSPVISADGQWLIYASNQSGNYDLWARPIGGGIPAALTTHPADEYLPAWSPKRQRICFVSHRDDPEGDIFMASLAESGGRLILAQISILVGDPGAQSFPSFSRDGRFLIYQEGRGCDARIALLDLNKRKKRMLTGPGYVQPRLSPRDESILCLSVNAEDSSSTICIIRPGNLKNPEPAIQIVYAGPFPATTPCWSPDGRSFVAALTNRDRDQDGLLTALDGSALYRFDEADSSYAFRPLTQGESAEIYPFWGRDGYIYYACDRRGNLDLWRIKGEGLIPRAPSAEAGLRFALSIGSEAAYTGRPLRSDEITARLLALEQVRRDFPLEAETAARSLLESARLSLQLGLKGDALSFLKRIPRNYPDQRDVNADALIDYQFQVHRARFSKDGGLQVENPTSLISNLQNILQQFPEQESAAARCYYLMASAWAGVGDYQQALRAFDTTVKNYPEGGDYPAEALVGIGDVYAQIGSGAEALATYLEEIRRFSDRAAPTEKAIGKVLALQVSGGDPIAGLQELIERHADLPALAAAAQKRIADLLANSGEKQLALDEYDRLRGHVRRNPLPYVRGVAAEGMIAAALLENQSGAQQAAQRRLEEVQRDYADLQDGYYSRRAHHLRVVLLTRSAEALQDSNEYEAALSKFQDALELEPGNVRLHRGKIAAAHALGRLLGTISEYRQFKSEREADPAALYALGLCLSYQAEENRRDLAESNALIEKAVALQPDLAYGYLTLGYNYLLMEKTAGGKRKAQRGIEKAINVLQLGLANNDETDNPELEAQLLLNLGDSYYELGEFGYPRALDTYLQRLALDSTFASPLQEAVVREKLGRTAAIIGRTELAQENYLHSLNLYQRSRQAQGELRLLLRLAELYQVLDQPAESNEYYRRALAAAQREGQDESSPKWLENMAYNALQMGDDEEAQRRVNQALQRLRGAADGASKRMENPLRLKILGLSIPLWNFGFLGTGSPASALGFGPRDELELNYSLLQEVSVRQKDLQTAEAYALKRLAMALQQQDYEMQANLWSEIGYFDWCAGNAELARRSFVRSLSLCQEHGLRAGRLSALINLACIALDTLDQVSSLDRILQREAELFGQSEIGMPQKRWRQIREALSSIEAGASAGRIKGKLRRALQILPDPDKESPEPWDWSLIDEILLLKEDPLLTSGHLRETLARELENFKGDPLGFDLERIRFYGLYAQLCLKAAADAPDSTIAEQIQWLALQAEALWAFRAGIKEAEQRGLAQGEVLLRLELSDYLGALGNQEGCAQELATAKQHAERSGRDDLLWRTYWRLGRLAMQGQSLHPGQESEAMQVVRSLLAEEWFEVAQELWSHLPADSALEIKQTQTDQEARRMLELAIQSAITSADEDQVWDYAQKLAALPLFEAARRHPLLMGLEKRKLLWGSGGGIIPHLQSLIQQQKETCARLAAAPQPDSAALKITRRYLEQTEHEYRTTLDEVIRDDPEFASLFCLFALPMDTLRETLQDGDLLVQVLKLPEDLRLILLDRRGMALYEALDAATALAQAESLRIASGSDLDAWRRISEGFFQALLSPISEKLFSAKRVFLVLPQEWTDLPVEWLWTGSSLLSNVLLICRLPDPQSLVFLKDRVSPSAGRNYSFGLAQSIEGFSPAAQQPADATRKELENAGAALLRTQTQQTRHPWDAIFFAGADKTWRIADLFSLNCTGETLILAGEFHEESLAARAGFFAGFSSVIFVPQELPSQKLNDFISALSEQKSDDSPGEAFYRALSTIRKNGVDLALASKFRYYGNGGLNASQRVEYARENFQRAVRKGNYHLEQGDGEWALRYYDRAVKMAEDVGDSSAMANLHQLRIRAAKLMGWWQEAEQSQQILIGMAERSGNVVEVETGWRNLSFYQSKAGKTDLAIQSLSRAEALAAARGDPIQMADDLRILAALYEKKGDFASAESAIAKAQIAFANQREGEDFIQSGIYLGRLYLAQEAYADAIRTLEELPVRSQKLADETGRKITLPAEYYQHLAAAYEGLGDYERALQNQSRALGALQDTTAEAAALTHQYLAGLRWRRGEYQAALSEAQRSRDLYAGSGRQQCFYLLDNVEALIHLSLSNLQQAEEKGKSALEGSILANDPKSQAQIERNLGLIELASGKPEKAKSRFLSALRLYNESGSKKHQARILMDLGNAYLQLNQTDSAAYALAQALNLGNSLPDSRVQAQSLWGLGLVELERNRTEKALEYCRLAAALCQESGYEELTWRVGLAAGKALLKEGHEQEALSAWEKAMVQVEKVYPGSSVEAFGGDFGEHKAEIYALAAALQIQRGNPVNAWEIAERARARAFLEIMQHESESIGKGLDLTSQARETEIGRQINDLRLQINWLKSKGKERTREEDSLLTVYDARWDSLEAASDQFIEEMELKHPGYRALMKVSVERPENILASLKANEAILEYFPIQQREELGLRKLAVIVATANGLKAIELSMVPDSLAQEIVDLRTRLDRKLDISVECQEFYRLLIAPALKHLRGIEHLIIVPCGTLSQLPFACLQDEQGAYLMDQFTLSFSSSASLFAACRKRAAQRQPVGSLPLLALGDPAAPEATEQLIYTQKEVASIGYAYPNTERLLGDQAQEAKLSRQGSRFGAIHFACHGSYKADDPLSSSLLLAPGGGEDGRLEAREVFDLRLDSCGLISLSACESGLGGSAEGEAMAGFDRAFVYAGSPRVVSTLWRVDDLATAVLVKRFYRYLKAGDYPALALRRAQQMVRDRIQAHPAYWAAFVLTGEPR